MSDSFTQKERDEFLEEMGIINKDEFEKRKKSVLEDITRLVIFDDAVGGLINLHAIESVMNIVKWNSRGIE